jgi:hypothetical protein
LYGFGVVDDTDVAFGLAAAVALPRADGVGGTSRRNVCRARRAISRATCIRFSFALNRSG